VFNFNPANDRYNMANVADLLDGLGEDGLNEEYTSTFVNRLSWAFNLRVKEFQYPILFFSNYISTHIIFDDN
jgi:hypothetical protein